jgi:hypothetical protein
MASSLLVFWLKLRIYRVRFVCCMSCSQLHWFSHYNTNLRMQVVEFLQPPITSLLCPNILLNALINVSLRCQHVCSCYLSGLTQSNMVSFLGGPQYTLLSLFATDCGLSWLRGYETRSVVLHVRMVPYWPCSSEFMNGTPKFPSQNCFPTLHSHFLLFQIRSSHSVITALRQYNSSNGRQYQILVLLYGLGSLFHSNSGQISETMNPFFTHCPRTGYGPIARLVRTQDSTKVERRRTFICAPIGIRKFDQVSV